ncbi:MAG: hydantoinase/oxoprolinase family protein [Gammaproteobacteria bacterium]
MQPKVIGWDIGGAHVKVAFANEQSISNVYQHACPLWKGINELSHCIESVQKQYDTNQFSHAVTMTGELVDHFDTRQQGVQAIIKEVSNKLDTSKVYYYAGDDGFLDATQAMQECNKIASANWLASTNYAASKLKNALFIDIGSTTTDIIEIREHKANYTAYTDEQRLIARELVYYGAVRTPVFAICKSALVKDQQIPVINEYFANTADVYRLTDELSEYADQSETLDGRDKSVASSAVRLARMFANDAQQDELEIWRNVAKQIRNAQIQIIKDACRHQFMKKNVSLATPIIGAGVGRFLVKDLAQQLGRDYIDFEELLNVELLDSNFSVADCAPAASVACLASSIVGVNGAI